MMVTLRFMEFGFCFSLLAARKNIKSLIWKWSVDQSMTSLRSCQCCRRFWLFSDDYFFCKIGIEWLLRQRFFSLHFLHKTLFCHRLDCQYVFKTLNFGSQSTEVQGRSYVKISQQRCMGFWRGIGAGSGSRKKVISASGRFPVNRYRYAMMS